MGCLGEMDGAGPPAETARPWWEHAGPRAAEGRLLIAGRDAEELARAHGRPLFVYDVTHVEENLRALQDALAGTGCPWKVRLALKSQPAPEILARVRAVGEPGTPGFVGLDVCSPGEVLHGLGNGFPAEEISYTGTNVSDRDLDVILESGVHVNLDLLSQIRRYGRPAPGAPSGYASTPGSAPPAPGAASATTPATTSRPSSASTPSSSTRRSRSPANTAS